MKDVDERDSTPAGIHVPVSFYSGVCVMPTFQVRNRRTKMVLGEVTVADLADVLHELKDATGSSIEEIALSLESTVEEAVAALDILEIRTPMNSTARKKADFPPLLPRRLFA